MPATGIQLFQMDHATENPSPVPPEGTGQLVLYRTEDGRARISVRLIQESVWLTLNQIADLFQRDKSVISKHIRNIFESGELDPARTVGERRDHVPRRRPGYRASRVRQIPENRRRKTTAGRPGFRAGRRCSRANNGCEIETEAQEVHGMIAV
jgi:hypothetical protein